MSSTSSDGLTVVLGWDGLDHELATEFGLAEAFGPHHARIETFDNPTLGTPHTLELWPSIVSGVPPERHGVWAATEDGGVEWSNPLLDGLSSLANGVVPEPVRERIGLVLRDAGANVQQKSADYYAERGIPTVFDGRNALPLAVPNYRTAVSDRLDLVSDRGADLADFLQIEREGGKTVHRPKVPLHEYEARLVGEAAKKLGIVRAAVERDYDLVFVWLGYLDSVGHIAPVAGPEGQGWQERSYRVAAEWTEGVRDVLTPEDTLVCVSDHGLQDGEHTHAPFLGSTDGTLVSRVDSVLDVAGAVDEATPATGTHDPEVRPQFRRESAGDGAEAAEVRGQLEDLGYL